MDDNKIVAELIPENSSYKVDGSGRIIIPSHMRARFGVELGALLEYFTARVDGKDYLCVRLN